MKTLKIILPCVLFVAVLGCAFALLRFIVPSNATTENTNETSIENMQPTIEPLYRHSFNLLMNEITTLTFDFYSQITDDYFQDDGEIDGYFNPEMSTFIRHIGELFGEQQPAIVGRLQYETVLIQIDEDWTGFGLVTFARFGGSNRFYDGVVSKLSYTYSCENIGGKK